MEHEFDAPECPDFGEVVGANNDRFQIVKALVLQSREILAITLEDNRPRWGVRMWDGEGTSYYEVFWSIIDAVEAYQAMGGE